MANEKTAERFAAILRYVAENIDDYLPDEWLLEGSSFVVRIPDRSSIPTVELDAEMPVKDLPIRKFVNGTTSEQS